MKYRTMPKSRDALSVLGLGLMRLPTRGDGSLDEEIHANASLCP